MHAANNTRADSTEPLVDLHPPISNIVQDSTSVLINLPELPAPTLNSKSRIHHRCAKCPFSNNLDVDCKGWKKNTCLLNKWFHHNT